MAATSPKPSDHHFSISTLISRFRSKKRSKRTTFLTEKNQHVPPDTRPPLIATPLPLVLPEHQHTLSTLGWTTLTFPPSAQDQPSQIDTYETPTPGPHPLQTAYESLFLASQLFFAQPPSEKQLWKHKLGSEEGWSQIPGEKEFITLRSLEYCPEVLREPARRYWELMGAHLSNTLGRISTALDLPDEALKRFVGPCGRMADAKTATMLRLFRYEGWEAKEVAEPHADLGLLSVVVGDTPGLEVWDGISWFACEQAVQSAGQKGATMLAGRQLERLSNGRYPAGGHRVVSYGSPKPVNPSPAAEEKRYRFSIVFVLRAHEPVVIHSADLETEVTGKWELPMEGVTAGKFFEQIRGRHFNINIGVDERDKQRRRLAGAKGKETVGSG